MGEIGQVVDADKKMLTVKLTRTEACAKCRACTAGFSKNDMLIQAENLCGASLDDYVNIELESKDFLKAVIIMYGVPFASFVLGIAAGILLTGSEFFAFTAGLVFMVISYLIIRLNEGYFKSKNYMPAATEIVTNVQPPL